MISSRSPLRHTTTLPLSHHRKCCGLAPSEASTSPAQFYISKCRAEVLNLWVVTAHEGQMTFSQELLKTTGKIQVFTLWFITVASYEVAMKVTWMGDTTAWGAMLKGCSVRKGEDHCLDTFCHVIQYFQYFSVQLFQLQGLPIATHHPHCRLTRIPCSVDVFPSSCILLILFLQPMRPF